MKGSKLNALHNGCCNVKSLKSSLKVYNNIVIPRVLDSYCVEQKCEILNWQVASCNAF